MDQINKDRAFPVGLSAAILLSIDEYGLYVPSVSRSLFRLFTRFVLQVYPYRAYVFTRIPRPSSGIYVVFPNEQTIADKVSLRRLFTILHRAANGKRFLLQSLS